jgi:flavin-dependent dehydrogenase
MDKCDVLIAGGGPAGSTCAWRLSAAGLDVLVMDRAVFPRDKVCAGWITPQVIEDLDLDVDEYRRGRTFQPITGFRTGLVGKSRELTTVYGRAVSFGIRRCEFDHYLLARAGARVMSGTPVMQIRRDGAAWIVNEGIRTPMLVGAGGHFCPVARWLNGPGAEGSRAALVVARETEFPIDPRDADAFTTEPETPALYFCPDLAGYGWCFRKQRYLNIGFGRLDRRSLTKATQEFAAFLAARGIVPPEQDWTWHGHAYWLYPSRQRLIDAGVVLVGDAAGLAYPQSGEGIRPAVESGLLAAMTIVEARGCYGEMDLRPYERRVRERLGDAPASRLLSSLAPPGFAASWAGTLLRSPRFVRHVVLDRWFLHAHQPALSLS